MSFWKKKKQMPIRKKVTLSKPVMKKSIERGKEDKTTKPKVNEKRADSRKEFLNVFRSLTYRHCAWDVWRDFIVMFACSLSNPVDMAHYKEREERYLKIIKKYNKQEENLFPELVAYTVMALEKNPEQDFLGSIFM